MVTHTQEEGGAQRSLMLRDALALITLLAVTGALFAITLLLFRAFSRHRDELARRWADRGAQSMREGHPDAAIIGMRTALNYSPGNRDYEMMLAEALGEAGRTDESYAYFQALWDGQPGSGFINLELARLAARRSEVAAAVNFYRGSIFGTWTGDGVARRAEVRLELARYLISVRQFNQAHTELLIAGGNSPGTAQFYQTIAGLLSDAQDGGDARSYYKKAVAAAPRDADVLEAAGEYAFRTADFAEAHRLLARSEAARGESHLQDDPRSATLLRNATRLEELTPDPSVPADVNAGRVLAARRIAKKRLDACMAKNQAEDGTLDELNARWAGSERSSSQAALRDPLQAEAALDLVYDTEFATKQCAAPSPDDALLLLAMEHRRPFSGIAASSTAAEKGAVTR